MNKSRNTPISNYYIDENQMNIFFNVLTANVERSRSPIVASLLNLSNQELPKNENFFIIEEAVGHFLQSKIRKSDVICKLSKPLEWCIILTHSGEKEASVFIERVLSDIKNNTNPLLTKYNFSLLTSIAEIRNSDVTFNEVIERSRQALLNLQKPIIFIPYFRERKTELIKVSILEDNEILAQALLTTLENLSLDDFQLDIRIFHDGYEFLESNRYYSSHTHIILVNDILPRKNGLEVVHRIRELPNNKKFIIFMMTKRKSEQDMIHAFKSGVDEYLMKPFNIRLFEAQVKRVLKRLWS